MGLSEYLNFSQLAGVAVVFAGVILSQEWPVAQKQSTLELHAKDEGALLNSEDMPLSVAPSLETAIVPLRGKD